MQRRAGWRTAARARYGILVAAVLAVTVLAGGALAVFVWPPGRVRLVPSQAARAPTLPSLPPVLPAGGGGDPPSPAGLARALAGALAPALADRALGRGGTSYAVVDVPTGRLLAGAAPTRPAMPASVAKLTTALAALATLGPQAQLSTAVVTGAMPGEVVLVGGGDPTLAAGAVPAYPAAAHLGDLAHQVRTALGATAVRRVVVDGSVFGGPTLGPGWDSGLVASGNVAPITGVMVDGGRFAPTDGVGRARSPAPDLYAGRLLARLLGAPAVPVVRGAVPAVVEVLGSVRSPPVERLVEDMLLPSDNVLAEALARQVAIMRGQPPTFAGAAAAIRASLAELGLPVGDLLLVDGSGLSRRDRLTARLLADVLVAAADPGHPRLRAVLTGLPVAGFSGTLDARYLAGPARRAAGQVRAKTGSLSGTSTLAGVLADADGRLLAFALLAEGLPAGGTTRAEAALDRIAATLAGCGCR